VLTQSDIDSMWARAHRSFHSGVAAVSAPKVKPASSVGPAPSDDDIPLALSSRRARASKSASNVDTRSLRSSGKAKASGSRSKYVVSDDESESAVEIVSAPKSQGPSLGDSAFCVPLDKKKEATRLTSGRPRHHEGKSSRNAVRAVSPAPDAVSAAVLEMLPKPRQLVCFLFLLPILYFYSITIF